MDSTYSGSFGRMKVAKTEFLKTETVRSLATMQLEEITRTLSTTAYREDINALYTLYTNPQLLEMAVNRRLSVRNKLALFAPPPAASDTLKAYLSKWDTENIKAILSSKYLGYSLKQTESFLLSFRDVPVGVFGGNMRAEDFTALASQQDVEGVAEALTRYGYGQVVLQYLEQYRKEGDIGPMLYALDRHYYTRLFSSVRYYMGSEGPLIRYLKEEVDMRNAKMLLSAKDEETPFDRIREFLIPYGYIGIDELQNLYTVQGMEELIGRISEKLQLPHALERYRETKELGMIEIEMKNSLLGRYLPVLDAQSLSICAVFAFILNAEKERDSLRTIVTGKVYGIESEKIIDMLMIGA
ncbi:MAG: V-type ATPase subunit [Methanomassiliicoccales archaeon]